MAVFDNNFVAVTGIVCAEPLWLRATGLHQLGNGLLQNACLECQIMVSRDVDQFDPTGNNPVQLINDTLIVRDDVPVELILVGIQRIVVNRQEPLIEKITCNHQFTHILCVLQALQKLDEQRPVFQRLGVAVFDTEVDIADDDDFVPNCIGRPQRRSVGIRTTAAPAAGSIQGCQRASARAKALDKISPGKFHFDSNEPVVVGGCVPHRVLRKL